MKNLELKIPPVAVAIIFAAIMWLVSGLLPQTQLNTVFRNAIVFIFTFAGAAVASSGIASFKTAKTTVHPMKPDSATALVTSGIYSITRNPMYVGLLFCLAAWGFYIESAYSLLLLIPFIAYMNKFQIQPEERALRNIFGEEFDSYISRVRRWL